MDTVSQMVLGAAVGEAVLGNKVGNKAMLWGALAANIPDHDIIPGLFLNEVDRVDLHRSYSHSLMFFGLLAPLLGSLFDRKIFKKHQLGWKRWTYFFFMIFVTHALLDCFTSWGTQLFWPLDYRITFKSIFVIDPLYTLPFLAFVFWSSRKAVGNKVRVRLNYAGIIISTGYLVFTLINKQMVGTTFEKALKEQKIQYTRYQTHPTPFNNILWSVTAETDSGFYIGFYSWLDDNYQIPFQYYEKRHHLLEPYKENRHLQKLFRITKGYYVVRKNGERELLFNSLRFGHPIGWYRPSAPFMFAYSVQRTGRHSVIVRKKEREVNEAMGDLFHALWKRISGVRIH